jgi:uncharacterized protein YprB with RNaseH-like and TPR domain
VQIEPQEFLDLAIESGRFVFVDIESTGFRGDYNSVLCGSVKAAGKKPITFTIRQPGNDQAVVRALKDQLDAAAGWCTYYGKGFDIPMLNTRLLKWHQPPIEKRPHVDMYYSLKANILTSRRSQGHLQAWLEQPEEKLFVSPDLWNKVVGDLDGNMPALVKRCESDVTSLEALFTRTRHLIRDIKR